VSAVGRRTVALSTKSQRVGTRLACGVWPIVSPPLTPETFRPAMIDDAGVLYLCLHGTEDTGYWYGDELETALASEQLAGCHLPRTVVLSMGCYGFGIEGAALAAGAAAVIGFSSETLAGRWLPSGSHWLGRRVLQLLGNGLQVGMALDIAVSEATRQGKVTWFDKEQLHLGGEPGARLPGW
jgi:hypothetical protein